MSIRRSTIRLFSTTVRRLQHETPADWKPLKKRPRYTPSKESLAYVEAILEKPTWSITELLPPSHPKSTSTTPPPDPKDLITPEKLRHLLRLSALPMPKDQQEEDEMIKDLNDQLYFVNKIKEVDVTGVEPLVAIRDESEERGITLEDVLQAEKEAEGLGPMGREEWDPLKQAKNKLGRYIVVEGEMGEGPAVDDELVVSAGEVKKVNSLGTVETTSTETI
ncbi:hypothetical protein TWF106_011647 [Orbilia oligospora]|uniref:Glutamyl-tRNA amidotransferase complex subunit Gta3 domain-containing protein n=1 Tax=Orbilia oligospora TaxID=2813651 RepID=A0A7C8Q1P6_ORBOL|nr:hypothetical protein TWF788_001492 [Orbilia oligospora]KAF3207628.1 hypothetical protein TWF106_011647 [Orbilia oligospora]